MHRLLRYRLHSGGRHLFRASTLRLVLVATWRSSWTIFCFAFRPEPLTSQPVPTQRHFSHPFVCSFPVQGSMFHLLSTIFLFHIGWCIFCSPHSITCSNFQHWWCKLHSLHFLFSKNLLSPLRMSCTFINHATYLGSPLIFARLYSPLRTCYTSTYMVHSMVLSYSLPGLPTSTDFFL